MNIYSPANKYITGTDNSGLLSCGVSGELLNMALSKVVSEVCVLKIGMVRTRSPVEHSCCRPQPLMHNPVSSHIVVCL